MTTPDYVPWIFFKVAMNSVSQQEMQELELDVVNTKPFVCSVANCREEIMALFLLLFLSKSKESFELEVHIFI